MEDTVTSVKLMFDWEIGPLWIKTDQYPIGDPYTADEALELVQLTPSLVAAINKWDARMQKTYDGKDHTNMGFADPAEEEAWLAEGRELAQRIKDEVDRSISVQYVPLIGDTETLG